MRHAHLFALVLMCLAPATQAQAQLQAAGEATVAVQHKPVDVAEQRVVLRRLADLLEARFVFPEAGRRYAEMLRAKAATDAYATITDPVAFGEAVTADLQAVAPDGHLRVGLADGFSRPRKRPAADQPASTRPSGPPGLEEASMRGDVAYLRFNASPGDPSVGAAARRFLEAHADARAVIIDARPHRGGGLMVMDAILPLLYAQRTTLVRMDTRASAAAQSMVEEGPSIIAADAPADIVRQDHVVVPDRQETRLQHVPVYYLVSRRTASAAEHLALAFKRTGRATLIGETTFGAGHYGGVEPVGDRFAAFVPVGRTYDPDTGQGWEGKGVAPDIEVPVDTALDKALELARQAGANPG